MKITQLIKFSLIGLLGAFMMVSCGDDDEPVINPGGGGSDDEINVQDGLFLTISGEDPSSTAVMVAEVVEANDFQSQERSGFVSGYMWLESGSYQVVQIEDKAVVATIGGVAETISEGAGSDCGHTTITKVTTEADGAAFTVGESGLYKVSHDQMTSELIMYNIKDASIIGSATPNGWGGDTPLTGSVTADGASWSAEGIILRSGEWKVRFNCNWGLNRRIDPNGSLNDADNGYQSFTNFGGDVTSLVTGGSNIQQMEDGEYTLTLEWTARDGFFLDANRTGDAPSISFNPNDFQMAVIGDATPMGWDADRNLFHKEEAGVHTWYGVVTFADAGEYKFRANDAWDVNYGGDLAGLTNGGDNIPTPGAGAWYIVLSTADEGETWTASVTDQGWGIIGDATPGGWDADTDMTSTGVDADGNSVYTINADLTDGEMKFRAGNDWAHNIGGDVTFLTVDGGNIPVTAGNYDITLMYNGEVYSATIQ